MRCVGSGGRRASACSALTVAHHAPSRADRLPGSHRENLGSGPGGVPHVFKSLAGPRSGIPASDDSSRRGRLTRYLNVQGAVAFVCIHTAEGARPVRMVHAGNEPVTLRPLVVTCPPSHIWDRASEHDYNPGGDGLEGGRKSAKSPRGSTVRPIRSCCSRASPSHPRTTRRALSLLLTHDQTKLSPPMEKEIHLKKAAWNPSNDTWYAEGLMRLGEFYAQSKCWDKAGLPNCCSDAPVHSRLQ